MEELDVRSAAAAAREAAAAMAQLGTFAKNSILVKMADEIHRDRDYILQENAADVEQARAAGRPESLIDRLRLDPARIEQIAQGCLDVAALPDPVGETVHGEMRPNGLQIIKRRVPIGVIGIIYESRPNVTADAASLCIKSGNSVVLKGGSDAVRSNLAIAEAMVRGGEAAGMPVGALSMIGDVSREATTEMMKMNGLIDVLIPRGGSGLIQTVVQNATVPVIETGTGNCHIFVDKTAHLDMAVDIVVNAKTSRPGVCNAAESLLVHKDIAKDFLPVVFDALTNAGVEIRGCELCQRYGAKPATEDDMAREYLDLIISVKVVDGIDEAIDHINRYGTGHSEAIITDSYTNSRRFQDEVDAAAVYVNASTRFTDGFEFGFGAEIGISTQRLHARGPLGLADLTTMKYLIEGNGQVR
ncbi:MAG: glutamate-5-semialdehyde dehydrogenase [Clostridia bacterium]|nr:glutamate-5-semialdehyde dehydrogenase [Clostridia bacterium]